ncbi:HEAT repeat-containing 4-like [Brachionus plicatilis]|uniref:HEAT repeat-containing 4-like n=1 Tax=Brachionus plicatilis TaxID=10195 RepID=A0A3M7R8Q9_BRAPC|nr:HEAT repeat-containing 4-like [Brachionus plicatilis]
MNFRVSRTVLKKKCPQKIIQELWPFLTLGLIGVYNESIRNALIWALQFESDPITRTEACHSTILLINQKDQQLVEILLDRHLVEEDSMVRNEIMDALIHLGYDPKSELPLVTKIKNDVKKLNDKNEIISKILEIEKEREFEFEKKRLIWDENEKGETKADSSREKLSQSSSDSFGPFEPRLIEKSAKKNLSKKSKRPNETSFLSRLVQQEAKEVTSSRNSFNLDFFIDEFTAEIAKNVIYKAKIIINFFSSLIFFNENNLKSKNNLSLT